MQEKKLVKKRSEWTYKEKEAKIKYNNIERYIISIEIEAKRLIGKKKNPEKERHHLVLHYLSIIIFPPYLLNGSYNDGKYSINQK